MRKLSLKELNRVSLADYKAQEKTSIILVLDNIRSALNVGSAFRTCDGLGLQAIHLCGISAQPPHKEIMKSAIGATESVDWKYYKETIDSIQDLKNAGYKIIGIEQTDTSIFLQNFEVQPDQKYALVFGNEVNGITDEVLEYLDEAIEIPQFGTKHSFNISIALGITCWEFKKAFLE